MKRPDALQRTEQDAEARVIDFLHAQAQAVQPGREPDTPFDALPMDGHPGGAGPERAVDFQ